MYAKLLIVPMVLLLVGCKSLNMGKMWMTLPDNEGINEALELKAKGEYKGDIMGVFIPINGYVGYNDNKKESIAASRALAIQQYFNTRKLITVDKIIEEFNRYHLPCFKEDSGNKLRCDYYVVNSRGPWARYYNYERGDAYILIHLTFEILDGEVKVRYDDQSCQIYFEKDNRITSFKQLEADLNKRGKTGHYDYEKKDARLQKCLNSDLYKTLQDYFKTHYPKKYKKAHLGAAEHE